MKKKKVNKILPPIIIIITLIIFSLLVYTLYQKINLSNKNKELNNSNNFQGFQKTIELKNICFSYDSNLILENLNLQIQKNKTIAILFYIS